MSIQVTAEVSPEDIKDALDFDDMVALYEPDARKLLALVDNDEILAYCMEQPDLIGEDTVRVLMEDRGFAALVRDMNNILPAVTEQPQSCDLIRVFQIGTIHAVIAGTKVRFKDSRTSTDTQVFSCGDSGLALRLLQAMAHAPLAADDVAGAVTP